MGRLISSLMWRASAGSNRPVAELAAEPFWGVPLGELLEQLHTSPQGLTADEARRRLSVYGPNEPPRAERRSLVLELVTLLANPLVLILLAASAVSAVLGEAVNAGLIVLIVGLSMLLDAVQMYRSQRAVERLREALAVTATVLRDGAWVEVPLAQVVPGDVVRLSAGDLVPADGRLIEARDLSVDQAALTGESLPVAKEVEEAPPGGRTLADARGAVFLGASVVSGTGIAVVVCTGRATAYGQIAARLRARPPETEFERGMRRFGLLIMRTTLLLVLFVFLVNALFRRDPLESFLFAVALAVGLTPEFLPMIITVTLAQGAMRMARQKVIVRRLAAIENFGSMDVLCSDKTGTLTRGEIALDRHIDSSGQESEQVALLAALNSAYQTGLKSPLDAAILRHPHPSLAEYAKVDEVPFDFQRRRVSVVVERAGERLLVTKGAPESVIPVCVWHEQEGRRRPLDAAARSRVEEQFRALSREGYRVLAVAYRVVAVRPEYNIADEQELILAGFAAFYDPPREDAATALEALRRDGITVKLLTGDNELVAQHVCRQVGLEARRIVLGSELDRMSDAALAHVAEEVGVFARVSPEQKLRILRALQHRGHVAGFLGDGINDAPALHAADVGISVDGAADVAREAAEIVLQERSLHVLHQGVLEGRRSFANITKYILMGTSSNFGNMLSMAGASIFLPFLPLLPLQILLNNFLYDLAQVSLPTDYVDASFLQRPRRWDVGFIQEFMMLFGPLSSLYDVLTFSILLVLFHAPPELFRAGWFIESLATQTLVIFVIRTAGNPLQSRPSPALVATVLAVAGAGAALPFTPLAPALGFASPPPVLLAVLALLVVTYLGVVELAKRWFYRHHRL
jgi:Mg2+-importing ATPase